ncbi:hypothetical protein DNTS_008978 [Danionella cerebrum]|uniref:Uncharacterized protein n=1 Tax=Danionella cerebrum TaxID=2873325 RepID=A0A553Q4E1_9TELE|nr:hypothetical protein DNTS_008978 [Danionella translucida]
MGSIFVNHLTLLSFVLYQCCVSVFVLMFLFISVCVRVCVCVGGWVSRYYSLSQNHLHNLFSFLPINMTQHAILLCSSIFDTQCTTTNKTTHTKSDNSKSSTTHIQQSNIRNEKADHVRLECAEIQRSLLRSDDSSRESGEEFPFDPSQSRCHATMRSYSKDF